MSNGGRQTATKHGMPVRASGVVVGRWASKGGTEANIVSDEVDAIGCMRLVTKSRL